MNLEEQIKVIFYSFSYGMFYYTTFKFLRKIKFKKNTLKYIVEFLFSIFHVIIYYLLLFLINGGTINYYNFIFLFTGMLFCHLLYFRQY